ncbi:PHP domain-containing protein [Anaerovorax odorimutans]|uniref:PHP domain-containing protein n=1 Tax=Anaerovorax odorimutans TaxID=109327 RepID=UPI000414AF35|nr:PHP domain-containing protein [Anaerovorax odorimutans]
MVDFHLHTYYSDGSMSPRDLVYRAKKQNTDIIAITDHDGLKGINEAIEAGKEFGVKVIPGIEFSAALEEGNIFNRNAQQGQEIYMHLLGYGFDTNNKEINYAVEEIQKKRKERNQKMLKALRDLGYDLNREDFQVYPMQEYVGKPNFARGLLKKGYVTSIKEAFKKDKFLGHPKVKSIYRAKIDAKKAIELICQAGGVPVLAHPMKISYKGKNEEGSFFDKLEPLLLKLKEFGLMGMECYYSSHLVYETERLLEIADKLDLLVTAGTDFHGKEVKEDIEIGEFPVLPDMKVLSKFLNHF